MKNSQKNKKTVIDEKTSEMKYIDFCSCFVKFYRLFIIFQKRQFIAI